MPDTDTDGDGTPDCNDQCVDDPDKVEPGACGCGVPDTDTDNDGIADCIDNCPNTANADQADVDGDGVGDACEVPGDDDVTITKDQKTEDSEWTDDVLSVAWGDMISYMLTITNTFETAVDLMIGDALSGLVEYVGDLTATVGVTDVTSALIGDIFGGWEFSGLGANETLTITFDVQVKSEDIVKPGDEILNVAWFDAYINGDLVIEDERSNIVISEVVPEPATVALLGLGLFGVLALARRKWKMRK